MRFFEWKMLADEYARSTYGWDGVLNDETYTADCFHAGWSIREFVDQETKFNNITPLNHHPPYKRIYDNTCWTYPEEITDGSSE